MHSHLVLSIFFFYFALAVLLFRFCKIVSMSNQSPQAYRIFRTIRRTQVLRGGKQEKKAPLHRHPPTPAVSQVSYIQTIRRTPIFLPNLGVGSASYSLKNTVYICKHSSYFQFYFIPVVKEVFQRDLLSIMVEFECIYLGHSVDQ